MLTPRQVYFITHPDVRVDPDRPVPDWSLSERGLTRMRAGLEQPWVETQTRVSPFFGGPRLSRASLGVSRSSKGGPPFLRRAKRPGKRGPARSSAEKGRNSSLSVVYSSAERKAREAAGVLAERLGRQPKVEPDLGEVDRSSTGYLPHDEHEAAANEMFAHPDASARGWETARHAQARIIDAVTWIVREDRTGGAIAIVSHGAVGAYLLCHLSGVPIDRKYDQPGAGGGNYFSFRAPPGDLLHGWQPIDRISQR